MEHPEVESMEVRPIQSLIETNLELFSKRIRWGKRELIIVIIAAKELELFAV